MSTPARLKTQPRVQVGSRAARKARAEGLVPVNIYGHGLPNASLLINAHELGQALHGTAQVFTLAIGREEESCLVREVQYDTYGQRLVHVDFTRIDLSEEVEVTVALRFTGHPKGLAEGGQQVIHHANLAVRCRADSIPDVIEIEISGITLGHSIHASEIALPPGVALDTHHMRPDEPIVGVALAKKEEEAKPAEAAPAEGAEGATPAAAEGDAKGKDGAPAKGGKEAAPAKGKDGGKGKG